MGVGGPALFAHCKPTGGTSKVSFLVAEVSLSLLPGHVGITLSSFHTHLTCNNILLDPLSCTSTPHQLWSLCPDGLLGSDVLVCPSPVILTTVVFFDYYKLHDYVHKGNVYAEVRNAWFGLRQAGRIANEQLTDNLRPFGLVPSSGCKAPSPL